MKKIFLSIIMLSLLSLNIYSQKQWISFGATKIKDSTNYTTFNRSVLMYNNLFVKGYIQFDTLASAKLSYSGNDILFENTKNYGGFQFWLGDKQPQLQINKLTATFPGYHTILTIDSTGIDLNNGQYKINGTPISGSGSTNLYGYAYKDSLNNFLQYNRFKHFTLYGSGSDSVGFFVKGGTGDLMVTPVGTGVTFGSTHGTGTKDVFAGEYYRGTTLLTTYYNTNTTFSNIPYLDKANTFSTYNKFTNADSSVIVKGVKGLTGQSSLRFFSPGDGKQGAVFYNSLNANQIYFYTNDGSGIYTMDNNNFFLGDGSTGRPSITEDAPSTSAVSYSFVSDKNTGLLWHSADNVSIVTGGTSRFTTSTTNNTSTLPLIVSGSSSYVLFPNLTSTERDALTPSAGMVIFNTTTTKLQVYAGGIWVDLH